MAALHPRTRPPPRRPLDGPSAATARGHDRRARSAARSRYSLGCQLPRLPESRLTRDDDDPVADLLRAWSGPEWTRRPPTSPTSVDRYRAAARIPQAAYGAMEYFRWAGRSQLRPDGLRYARRMSAPISAPTLQLHGGLDPCVLPDTALGSGRYVAGAYEWRELPGLGHFLPEEAPDHDQRRHRRAGRAESLAGAGVRRRPGGAAPTVAASLTAGR